MAIPESPHSRVENYLGNLIGQETAWEPGNPESRTEEYLDYILQNGTVREQEIEDEVSTLKAIGRFLSLWNAGTGLPETDPAKTLPYKYKTGDYYIVSVIGENNNYEPSGTQYTGAASTVLYSGDLSIGDFFFYDGHIWKKLTHSEAPEVGEITISDSGAVTQALEANYIYHFTGALTSLTITLTPATGLAQYHFDFRTGSTVPTFTTTGIIFDDLELEANTRYEVDVLNGYGAVLSWPITNS